MAEHRGPGSPIPPMPETNADMAAAFDLNLSALIRDTVLDTASEVINGERDHIYGDPKDSFTRIATFWSEILGTKITPTQVGLMLMAMKLSRLSTTPDHQDSYVDMAGYAALSYEVNQRTEDPS